jgi:hypothetical protein
MIQFFPNLLGSIQKERLLLDDFPNAAVAYSLRLLNSQYTGDCIEVRRSSDDTTQNIGFVNGVLDTASLLSFVGAGDGFVRTWYDQSSNNNHATNTNENEQPRIVINGQLIINITGLPTVNFNDIAASLIFSNVSILDIDATFFLVTYNPLINSGAPFGASPNFGPYFTQVSNQDTIWGQNGFQTYSNPEINFNYRSILIRNNNDYEYYSNGFLKTKISFTLNNSGLRAFNRIGRRGTAASEFFRGDIQEIILYQFDNFNNRQSIENNIFNYYNFEQIGGLLFEYPNAAAAYSLRQLITFKRNGIIPLVRVRRSSDNLENNFTESQITDGTLLSFVGAGDGFVSIWFDQSGNNRHASVGVTSQPQIVSNGSLILENGKPAIEFESKILNTSGFSVNTLFTVAKVNSVNNVNYISTQGQTSGFYLNRSAGNKYGAFFNPNVREIDGGTLVQDLTYFNISSGNLLLAKNSNPTSNAGTSPTTVNTTIIGGQNTGTNNFRGKIQELIYYNIDQSTNRTNIESNINDYYNIF